MTGEEKRRKFKMICVTFNTESAGSIFFQTICAISDFLSVYTSYGAIGPQSLRVPSKCIRVWYFATHGRIIAPGGKRQLVHGKSAFLSNFIIYIHPLPTLRLALTIPLPWPKCLGNSSRSGLSLTALRILPTSSEAVTRHLRLSLSALASSTWLQPKARTRKQ